MELLSCDPTVSGASRPAQFHQWIFLPRMFQIGNRPGARSNAANGISGWRLWAGMKRLGQDKLLRWAAHSFIFARNSLSGIEIGVRPSPGFHPHSTNGVFIRQNPHCAAPSSMKACHEESAAMTESAQTLIQYLQPHTSGEVAEWLKAAVC